MSEQDKSMHFYVKRPLKAIRDHDHPSINDSYDPDTTKIAQL